MKEDTRGAYVEHLLDYIDLSVVKPLKIVCNAGNGGAGIVIDALESKLPVEFTKVHHEADGNFPNGVPNPLLEENRPPTIDAIVERKADLGIAWDGDFDRCFFFDENGRFIEGYYIVGLLAQAFPGAPAGIPGYSRSTPDLEYHRNSREPWRRGNSKQNRACVYQGADAGRGCCLRW